MEVELKSKEIKKRKKMKGIFSMILLFPLIIIAQSDNIPESEKGIKWTTNLSWEQIRKKAKEERKYIFLDCYTTWCGPCKTMDQQVFPDSDVGTYFNKEFISVKVQLDRTKNDDEKIKIWYNDSDSIGKKYQVEGYPTFIFISPDGVVVSKEMGVMEKQVLLDVAKAALIPGKEYNDPQTDYVRLKESYLNGSINKNYDRFPHMIAMALKAQDIDFGKQLLNEHTAYVKGLKPKERYTEENINLWAGFMLKSDGQRFRFFYKDGNIIDKVMKKKGYAAKIVDRTIWNEIVTPFLEEQSKGSGIAMSGMMLSGPGIYKLKPNYSEADWKKLKKMIQKQFTAKLAKRNVVAAKVEWYVRHRNYIPYVKFYLIKLKKYTPDLKLEYVNINSFGWNVFLHVTNNKAINETAGWLKKVLHTASRDASMIDTYANLLYKAGKKGEAIYWQEKAVTLQPNNKGMVETLVKMRNNESIHIKDGALW